MIRTVGTLVFHARMVSRLKRASLVGGDAYTAVEKIAHETREWTRNFFLNLTGTL